MRLRTKDRERNPFINRSQKMQQNIQQNMQQNMQRNIAGIPENNSLNVFDKRLNNEGIQSQHIYNQHQRNESNLSTDSMYDTVETHDVITKGTPSEQTNSFIAHKHRKKPSRVLTETSDDIGDDIFIYRKHPTSPHSKSSSNERSRKFKPKKKRKSKKRLNSTSSNLRVEITENVKNNISNNHKPIAPLSPLSVMSGSQLTDIVEHAEYEQEEEEDIEDMFEGGHTGMEYIDEYYDDDAQSQSVKSPSSVYSENVSYQNNNRIYVQ